jgi:hypothetical protein
VTGPEHYREAERLLAIPVTTDPDDQGAVIALHLAAVAHAALALVAATVTPRDVGPEQSHGWRALEVRDPDAWQEIAE